MDKSAVLAALEGLHDVIKLSGHNPCEANGVRKAIGIIEEIPDWITVKECLPGKPKENPLYDNKPLEIYLVSVQNIDCVIRAFWNGVSFTDGWDKLDVLAWMPLREPYKEADGC